MNERALRVSLDVTAVPPEPAGAGRYTIELAGALSRRADVELVLIARRADERRWQRLAEAAPGTELHAVAPAARPARLAWEQAGLPGLLDRLRPDVHHSPHYTMPERARRPVVVTVHDCTFFDHPEWHERSKVMLFRRAIRQAARRAAVLVCVSDFTAARLARVVLLRAPVVVAPHGVDHQRFVALEPSPGADATVLRRLALDPDRSYVAYLGTIEPRKGVAPLIEAFDRVAATYPDVRLVLAGQEGWGSDDVGQALSASPQRDRIVVTGYIPDDTVPALLRRARAVAYPALEEGYGLPALEALACGAPLVTTAGSTMAELARGAALLVEPGDAGSLAAALDALLSGGDQAGIETRRVEGLAVAAACTWEASAERHVEAYRRALEVAAKRRP
jgi:glycosyltransferase involved in cell wall biosynthesis